MQRLRDATARIPDTTGVIWASADAMGYWEPRIASVSKIWRNVELHTVFSGMRDACIVSVSPNELVEFSEKIAKNRCTMTILSRVAETGYYSSGHQEAKEGQPFSYRIAVHKEPDAFEDNQRSAIFRLGYPGCCVNFFERWWIGEGFIDITYPQYENSGHFYPGANVIYKCIGIRPVFHLPCSFDCRYTLKIASEIGYLMKDMGNASEYSTIMALCDMPAEWSALHGYAEIRTPIMKIITKTEATADECNFQLTGAKWPHLGVEGNKFPWNTKDSLSQELLFSENGFPTEGAEEEAHFWLINELVKFLDLEVGSLVDLGCGNGVLLSKIRELRPNLKLSGVDISLDKCYKAQKTLKNGIQIDCKNIFHYDLVSKDYILIAEQRLQENPIFINKLKGLILQYNYTTKEFKTIDRRSHEITGVTTV